MQNPQLLLILLFALGVSGLLCLIAMFALNALRSATDRWSEQKRTEAVSKASDLDKELIEAVVRSKAPVSELISNWQRDRADVLALASRTRRPWAWTRADLLEWVEREREARWSTSKIRVRLCWAIVQLTVLSGALYLGFSSHHSDRDNAAITTHYQRG